MTAVRPSSIRDGLDHVHSMPQGNAQDLWTHVRVDINSADPSVRTATGLNIIVEDTGNSGGSLLYHQTHSPKGALISAGQKAKVIVSRLTLVCDTLTVRCRWHLPECDVLLYARRLVFEGDGCIDTSPSPWDVDKAKDAVGTKPGGDGARGHDAGNVTAFVGQVCVPEGTNLKRLVMCGGPGQSGGLGLPGQPGTDSPKLFPVPNGYRYKCSQFDSWATTRVDVPLNKHGNRTVVGVKRHWKTLEWIDASYVVDGSDRPPTSGHDAIKPGKAGDGGKSGQLVTNLAALADLACTDPGLPGHKAPSVAGGRAGTPTHWALYDCTFWVKVFGGENSGSAKVTVAVGDTLPGANAEGEPGRPGEQRDVVLIDAARDAAWFHPMLAPQLVDWLRDAYLGEARDQVREVLHTYAQALQVPIPLNFRGAVWLQQDKNYWRSLQTEVATLSQRLEAGLDYFGKPAGYMPLLSLAGTLQMYRMDIDMALEVLLFTDWVTRNQKQGGETAQAQQAALALMAKENRQLADRLARNEQAVARMHERIDGLDAAQAEVTGKLGRLRLELMEKASGDVFLHKQIKFATNLAAALCQVVPVGQPILGGVASMAAISTELLDDEPDHVLEKLKGQFKETVAAYKEASKQADEAVAAAKKQVAGKKSEAGTDKAQRKNAAKNASKNATKADDTDEDKPGVAWSSVAKNLAPAWTQLKTAWANTRVADSEIEAGIAKLAAQSDEWKDLSKQIQALIDQRGEVANELLQLTQDIGSAYSALTDNVDSMLLLQAQQSININRLLNNSVLGVIDGMRSRARLTLTESLYNVVRAFESNLLRPVLVNWSLDEFYQDVNKLLDKTPNAEWDDASVLSRTAILRTMFTNNLRAVRDELRKDLVHLDLKDMDVDVVINAPDVLAALNAGEDASLDALSLNLVDPDWQRHMLAGMTLRAVVFEPGTVLPAQGDLEVFVRLGEAGIIRRDTRLYGVHLDGMAVHSFRYHFDGGQISQTTPSLVAEDILRFLLDDPQDKVRQKVALPPLWTDFTLRVSCLGTNQATRPRIQTLKFRCKVSALVAERNQLVLQVSCNHPDLAIECPEWRPQPFNSLYRVQDGKGRACTLRLAGPVPEGWHFDKWEVSDGGGRRELAEAELSLAPRQHTQVRCLVRRG